MIFSPPYGTPRAFKFYPGLSSWATFSRPCGTGFENLGSSHADSKGRTLKERRLFASWLQSMETSRILVISDSFHTMPEAVAMLETSGHAVRYVPGLTPWVELGAEDRRVLQEARAVIMGRVLRTDAAAFSLAPNLRVIALHTSGSDNVDIDEATRRQVVVTNVKGVNAEQCAEFAMG